MNGKPLKFISVSVKAKLKNIAQRKKLDFNYILNRYGIERLLYRLSESDYNRQFVLKGATLYQVWEDAPHRATKDVDLLGYGSNDVQQLEEIFRGLCELVVDDGLKFISETVRGEIIKEEEKYSGVRIKLSANMGKAEIPLQIDIGFGDAVVPAPEIRKFPVFLSDLPAPQILTYPLEVCIAEKFEAIVKLGKLNSRTKDFYDIFFLSFSYGFSGKTLASSIKSTFEGRGTEVPDISPVAFSEEYYNNQDKQRQWKAFIKRNILSDNGKTFPEVIKHLESFLLPPSIAIVRNEPFDRNWVNGKWD
jgi:predicted nucleotidyltransferase component of viral defense system